MLAFADELDTGGVHQQQGGAKLTGVASETVEGDDDDPVDGAVGDGVEQLTVGGPVRVGAGEAAVPVSAGVLPAVAFDRAETAAFLFVDRVALTHLLVGADAGVDGGSERLVGHGWSSSLSSS